MLRTFVNRDVFAYERAQSVDSKKLLQCFLTAAILGCNAKCLYRVQSSLAQRSKHGLLFSHSIVSMQADVTVSVLSKPTSKLWRRRRTVFWSLKDKYTWRHTVMIFQQATTSTSNLHTYHPTYIANKAIKRTS